MFGHAMLSQRIALLTAISLLYLANFPLRAIDKVRVETRVDEAIEAFDVDGEGVIVALLDRGIDWQIMTSGMRMARRGLNTFSTSVTLRAQMPQRTPMVLARYTQKTKSTRH